MTSSQGIERITDALGYLVINEDGAVLSSGGDLENDEKSAEVFVSMVRTASKVPLGQNTNNSFKRLSVIWDSFMYVITTSNRKIYVCKRRYVPQEPAMA